MWLSRSSHSWFIVCAILLSFGFLLSIKVLYMNYQKRVRAQEISNMMTDLDNQMSVVERVAHKTSDAITRLIKTKDTPHVLRVKFKMS